MAFWIILPILLYMNQQGGRAYKDVKWNFFYRKKVVIRVPLHIKKVHHTHTVYKVIKEAHHTDHGGQAADHASHHHSWH
jgi:hypothetical protein